MKILEKRVFNSTQTIETNHPPDVDSDIKKRFAFLYKSLNCNQNDEEEFQFEEIRAIDYYRADAIKKESEERLRNEYEHEINTLKRKYKNISYKLIINKNFSNK